jgi:hypothetical protein
MKARLQAQALLAALDPEAYAYILQEYLAEAESLPTAPIGPYSRHPVMKMIVNGPCPGRHIAPDLDLPEFPVRWMSYNHAKFCFQSLPEAPHLDAEIDAVYEECHVYDKTSTSQGLTINVKRLSAKVSARKDVRFVVLFVTTGAWRSGHANLMLSTWTMSFFTEFIKTDHAGLEPITQYEPPDQRLAPRRPGDETQIRND